MSNELNIKQIEILKKFRQRLLKEKFLNHQSSVYYSKQNNKFVIPGILITGIASIASFLSTSDMFENDVKKGSAIGVGILTAGATILQSISTSFGFKTRADSFQKSADTYDDLLTRIEFEIVNPNEDFNEFCNDMESEILKIKSDNKYFPPLYVHDLWDKFKLGLFKEEDSFFSVVIQKLKDTTEEYGKQEFIEQIQNTKKNIKDAIELTIETNETIKNIKQEHQNVISERERIITEILDSQNVLSNSNSNSSLEHNNSRMINFINGNTNLYLTDNETNIDVDTDINDEIIV
jgi:hypothetical protein